MLKIDQPLLSRDAVFDTVNVIENIGVKEANSISSGPDDGSIDKLASLFWVRQRHATLQQFRSNMSDDRRDQFPAPQPGTKETRAQNIGGHGSPGFVEAGDGQDGDGPEYVADWNEEYWGWPLALAGPDRDGALTIWSCSTGASFSGAYLLFRMSQVTRRSVRARTGLVLVVTQGSRRWLEFERGSQWQMATPDMTEPPDPIKPPSLPPAMRTNAISIPIVWARVSRLAGRNWTTREISGTECEALSRALFPSAPMTRDGDLPARVTAAIELRTAAGDELRAKVLADAIVEIEGVDARFVTGPELAAALEALIAR